MIHAVEVTSRELAALCWAVGDLIDAQRKSSEVDHFNDHPVLVEIYKKINSQLFAPGVFEDAAAEREAENANKNQGS